VKSISDIKHELFYEYKVHLDNGQRDKIVDILMLEGKKTLGSKVKAETLLFDDFIYASNYFLTPLDLWILVNKYHIPSIFITSSKKILQNHAEQIVVGYSAKDYLTDEYVFIVIPGLKPEQVPKFKLIIDESNNYFIPINKLHYDCIDKLNDDCIDTLNDDCIDKIRNAFDNKLSIHTYLDTFIKPKTKSVKLNWTDMTYKAAMFSPRNDEDNVKPAIFKKMPKKKLLNIVDTSPITEVQIAPTKTKRSKITLKGRTQTKKLRIKEDQPVV
jgi:hypothetical protein